MDGNVSFRSDKEKNALGNELQDLHAQLEQSKKQKVAGDKSQRAMDEQINELRSKLSDCESNLSEADNRSSKGSSESANLSKLLEEAEHKLGIATKNNKSLESQLVETKQSSEDESKVCIYGCYYTEYIHIF